MVDEKQLIDWAAIMIPTGITVFGAYLNIKKQVDVGMTTLQATKEELEREHNEHSRLIQAVFKSIDERKEEIKRINSRLLEVVNHTDIDHFATKEYVDIHLESLKASDNDLQNQIKELRIEVREELKDLKELIRKHRDEDLKNQNLIIEKLSKIG